MYILLRIFNLLHTHTDTHTRTNTRTHSHKQARECVCVLLLLFDLNCRIGCDQFTSLTSNHRTDSRLPRLLMSFSLYTTGKIDLLPQSCLKFFIFVRACYVCCSWAKTAMVPTTTATVLPTKRPPAIPDMGL